MKKAFLFLLPLAMIAGLALAQAPEFTYQPPQEVAYWTPPAGFGEVAQTWNPPPQYKWTGQTWAPPKGWKGPTTPWAPPAGWGEAEDWAPPGEFQ